MNPHERAMNVLYRVAGLLRRKDIEFIESEIGSAQHEVRLQAERLARTSANIEDAAKTLRALAERITKPEP
jgi:hypothetical protein